jgi:hypothetical protein
MEHHLGVLGPSTSRDRILIARTLNANGLLRLLEQAVGVDNAVD